MKNLTGSLIALKKETLVEDFDTKRVEVSYGDDYTSTEIHRRSSNNCCICLDSMWIRDNGNCNWLIGTKVMDPSAYVGGLPDYLSKSNLLLEVHSTCMQELKNRVSSGLFINNPNVTK